MAAKSDQLQIRVTASQKAQLRRNAKRAGLDVSSYVLSRALPQGAARVQEALDALREERDRRFAFAALADVLASFGRGDLADAVAALDVTRLSAFAANYATALVERACASHGIPAPAWTRDVMPLDEPWFATPMQSLRMHLLRMSPVVFKRRNLFVDQGLGGRV